MSGRPAASSGLGHYLRVLRRGAVLIVITVSVVTAIAIVASLSQEKRYEAHADVYLSGARNLPSELINDASYFVDPERAGNTQATLARVPAVAERALDEAGVRDRTAEELLANSTVSIPSQTDILRFAVTEESKPLATSLATAYAVAYTDYRRELDTRAIVRARRQIERRADAVQSRSALSDRLTEEAQQLRTAEALQASNVAVVRRGSEASQVQPRPRRNAILGGIFGLMLGIALVFVRDALNTRVRSPEEVQERLELPLIGRIPAPRRRPKGADPLVMLAEPYAPGTEAFRLLATNLGFANLDRGAKSILFTSATDGEGKSTTVANLAIALARTGSRVSLVDLDLKRPALERLFNIDRDQPGLTSVALGMIDLSEAVVEIPIADPQSSGAGADRVSRFSGRLELLPTGPLPPDSAGFVASPTLADILGRLSERSDVVLVDTPPMPHVSDAMALAGKVDAVVVVTRLSVVRRQALDELRRILDSAPVAKLGFVLTGVPAAEGYGYGYGYGYGGTGNGAGKKGRRKERII